MSGESGGCEQRCWLCCFQERDAPSELIARPYCCDLGCLSPGRLARPARSSLMVLLPLRTHSSFVSGGWIVGGGHLLNKVERHLRIDVLVRVCPA
jgi:hypothetical protein